jgi:hypothetical protein
MTDRIPFNEFSNDLEVMPSSDTMYYNVLKIEDSARLDRFKTRIDESNRMKMDDKSDWKKEIEEYHNTLMRNERNNGREDMANAIREVWSAKLYRNDLTADDLIQSAKIYLQNKDK